MTTAASTLDRRPFSQVIRQWSWDDTTAQIAAMTGADVERALAKARLDVADFMALISPAADAYLEPMARRAREITLRRFGRTVSMYIPLYVSNACTNSCVYCGFNHHNDLHRVTLTPEQIRRECEAIRRLGPFDNLLLVSGEFPALNGPKYLAEAVKIAGEYFNNITIEVMPMRQSAYKMLVDEGINGVVCFQETYNRDRYNIYHPRGMKSIFDWRVDGFDRMGAAGVHKIGMGVLIGLEKEWQTDLTMLARHLRWLKQRHWQARFSVNFPRMCPAEGGYQPNVVMTDRELVRATLAMRIFEPDADISYSTREPASLRHNMLGLAVTSMSAGSRTDPGGYAGSGELEQFHVTDERAPLDVAADIRAAGFEPVWKDWDRVYN